MKYSHSTDQTEEFAIEDNLYFEMRKLHFLLILEENVLKLLKCMIKLAMNKSSIRDVKYVRLSPIINFKIIVYIVYNLCFV